MLLDDEREEVRAGRRTARSSPSWYSLYEVFDSETREPSRSHFDSTPGRRSVGDFDPELLVFHHAVGETNHVTWDWVHR